jgi:ssDNA thymidine ADP-ribosyltransferase, DarT
MGGAFGWLVDVVVPACDTVRLWRRVWWGEGRRVDRSVVTELHFITPLANLPSIASRGILCHRLAQGVPHDSVALTGVQDRRAGKRVPQGLRLHEYANLYFDARNPMMSYLKHYGGPPVAVLRVDPAVLDIAGAVISDGNAATQHTLFAASPDGLAKLEQEFVYAEWWADPDPIIKAEKKRRRCAEVLVPGKVPVSYIQGVWVEARAHLDQCFEAGFAGKVRPYVFFQ